MCGVLRDGLIVACAVSALWLGPAARADARTGETCTREDAQSAGPGTATAAGARPEAVPEATAIAAEAAHALPPVTVEVQALPAPARRSFWPARFVDHLDLGNRLRSIKRLKIVPVWDNARITVFIGVDRSGVAGLHIQQQDPYDLPPLLARAAPLADAPPLRAVPLRSP